EAHPVRIDGDIVVVGLPPRFEKVHLPTITGEAATVTAALAELLGRPVGLKVVLDENVVAPAGDEPPSVQPAPADPAAGAVAMEAEIARPPEPSGGGRAVDSPVGLVIETYQEGGLNAYEHKLPGRTSYGNVTFKGGVAAASEMWDWFNDVSMGIVERKNVSVIMHWQGGLEAMRWNLEAAFPVSWEGPNFAAGQADTTLQTLQLAHQGISLGI
ncbi:MAG: phage tail protein, partial [Chloroflexi bacterium]|nr:phage tail protein [Chloroflexota bacterium]